jgi:hypothetical protein
MLFCARYIADRQWGRDYWEHAVAVAEMAHHPLHPRNPYTGRATPSILLDPWHLLVGQLARIHGLGAERAIQLLAPAQLLAALLALRQFARHFISWRWAPVVLLAATLVLWGWQPWVWSGLLDLNGVGFIIDYPSMIALAALLIAAVTADSWLDGGQHRHLWTATACLLAVAACSPVTLPAAAVIFAGLLSTRGRPTRRHLLLASGAAGATVVGLLSTRVPISSLLTTATDVGQTNQFLYVHIFTRLGLAIPGVIGLGLRCRRRWCDAVAVTTVLAAAVYVTGDLVARPDLGRTLVVLALGLHVGWVELIGAVTACRLRWLRRPALWASAACFLAGTAGAYSAFARAIPTALLPARYAQDPRQTAVGRTALDTVRHHITHGDVVADLTLDLPAVFVLAGGHLLYTEEDPLLDQVSAREQALDDIAADNPAGRRAIRRWSVTKIWCRDCHSWEAEPGVTVVVSTRSGTLLELPGQRDPRH